MRCFNELIREWHASCADDMSIAIEVIIKGQDHDIAILERIVGTLYRLLPWI